MTQDEMKELKKGIYQMSVYYNRNLPPEVISMMAEDLSGYDFASILKAFKAYRRDPKNSAFPLPAKIIGMIEGKKSERIEASYLAIKLDQLAQRFGSTWNDGSFYDANNNLFRSENNKLFWSFEEALKDSAGELAVKIISKWGGWKAFSASSQNTDQGQFVAQLRDFIEGFSIDEKSERLRLDKPEVELLKNEN
jgi:hypothetical protein